MIRLITALGLAIGLSSTAFAECTVLSGGLVYQNGAPQEGLTVVLDEGVIVGVGRALRTLRVSTEDGNSEPTALWGGRVCAYVQLEGQHLVPGFVEAESQLGLVEVDLEGETRNDSAGADPIRAGMVVADAYNPRSTLIAIQRLHGVTSAVVSPVGGLFSGTGGWVDLAGAHQSDAVRSPELAQFASVKFGESRAEALLRLRESIEDGVDYRRNRGAVDRNQRRDYVDGASRADLSALGDVGSRQLPLVVRANRAADIEALLRLRKDLGINMAISGGAEAWMLADELAAAGVGVILDPYVYGPGGFDQIFAREDNAKILHEAGVLIVLSTMSTHNIRNLRQAAGNAVRAGLDHAAAINAITTNVSTLFGQKSYEGIVVGSTANLVVWSDEPLEFSSEVVRMFVRGQEVALESRQTKLRDRYRTLPVARDAGLSIGE